MPETLTLPKTLATRYAIERELGGGLATITYVARDLTEGRLVAVRILRPEALQAGAADRFAEAVAAAAALKHPNILPIVDSGRSGSGGDEIVYAVTPFVEEGSLRQRLEREPQLPLDEALRIASAVAAAVDAAHRAGVLHRHLKPENVLLSGGEALVDFSPGAAVGKEATPSPEAAARTIGYLSPEQIQGPTIDGRSDQYAIGVLLYEMLAGRPPFTAPTPQLALTKVLTEAPPRLTALRVVPRIVERAVYTAMAKQPGGRFRTGGEFAAALHGAQVTPPTSVPTPVATRRRWRAPLVAGIGVLITAAAIGLASRAVVNRQPTGSAEHEQLTFTTSARAPVLSPDGRSVLYVAGGRSLVVQPLNGGEPRRVVANVGRIEAAQWTGDGRALVVTMAPDSAQPMATYLVAASGGRPRKVADGARPFAAGPDSTIVLRAAERPGALEVVSVTSGKPTRTIPLPDTVGQVDEIAWSPDRRWIAVTAGEGHALWVVAASGNAAHRLADEARAPRWGEEGTLYYLSGPAGRVDLVRVPIDLQSGRAAARPSRVRSLLAANTFDIGPHGRLVHTQTTRGAALRTFVLGGSRTPRLLTEEAAVSGGAAVVESPAVSPDGRWIAHTATRGSERDIHVVGFDGGSARVVARSAAIEEAPAWSPDGTRLAFARADSTGRRVVMADARTGAATRVSAIPGTMSGGSAPRWSASGRHIAYYAADSRRIVLVNLQRRNESVIRMPDNVGEPHDFVVPSPNGTQLIAATRVGPDGRTALWLVYNNGRRWRRLPGPFGESVPIAWHRNGWIYLVRDRAVATDHGATHAELWRMRTPTGRPELYATLPEGCGPRVSIAADASRGVCEYTRVESDLYVAGRG